MRIAYVLAWRGGRTTGPFHKMALQAATWTELGHEVALFVCTDGAHADDWRSLPETRVVRAAGSGGAATTVARLAVSRAARQWRPDVVYLRHGAWAPGLGRLAASAPTVLEVNGDERAVLRTRSSIRAAWAALTRDRVLDRARGAVFVTHELADSPAFAGYGFSRLVVGNGIDLAAHPPAPPSSDGPRLLLVGHPRSPWHGVDKLVGVATRHPQWRVDVVGPTDDDLGAAAPPNLHLHPEGPPASYLPLLMRADIGLGTLAMHRIGAAENSALKVREYLARGLAVVSGGPDPDVPPGVDWYLQLPNTEDNLEVSDAVLTEFVERWTGRRVPRAEVAHLDARTKERERLAFLTSVMMSS